VVKRPVGLYPQLSDLLDRSVAEPRKDRGRAPTTPHYRLRVDTLSTLVAGDVVGHLAARGWTPATVISPDYLELFLRSSIRRALELLVPEVLYGLPAGPGTDWSGLLMAFVIRALVAGEDGTLSWKDDAIETMARLLPLVGSRPENRGSNWTGRWYRTAFTPPFTPVTLGEFCNWIRALPPQSMNSLFGLPDHRFPLLRCYCSEHDTPTGEPPGSVRVSLKFGPSADSETVPRFLDRVPGALWFDGKVTCLLSCVTTPSGVQFYCSPGATAAQLKGGWSPAYKSVSPDLQVVTSSLERDGSDDPTPVQGPPSPPRRWHTAVASAVVVAAAATGLTLAGSSRRSLLSALSGTDGHLS